jgi:hypothetical protein
MYPPKSTLKTNDFSVQDTSSADGQRSSLMMSIDPYCIPIYQLVGISPQDASNQWLSLQWVTKEREI